MRVAKGSKNRDVAYRVCSTPKGSKEKGELKEGDEVINNKAQEMVCYGR